MLKRLAAAIGALLFASLAHAGPYDGVYACAMQVPALHYATSTYVVFLSHSDGTAGYSVLNALPSSVYGYALGTLQGTTFSGTDSEGLPFSATINPSNNTVTATGNYLYLGTSYPTSWYCAKFF